MAFKIITGVKETVSGQSGTGSFSSDGADGNYLAANSQLSNGDSSVFIIRSTDEPETQREIFVGTLTTGTPDSFSRDTTIYSSNGGFGGSSITLDAGKTYTLAGVVDPSHTVLDITSLTAETTPADSDLVAIYDASANVLRKMTRSDFLTAGGTTFVQDSGDTMSGDLTIAKTTPTLTLNDTGASDSLIIFEDNGTRRLDIRYDDSADFGRIVFYNASEVIQSELRLKASGVLTDDSNNELWHAGNVSSAPGLSTSDSSNGYVDLPGGITLQWGQQSVSSNSDATVTFPKSFSNFHQATVTGNIDSTGAVDSVYISITVKGNSQMTITNNASSNQTAFWMAVGST